MTSKYAISGYVYPADLRRFSVPQLPKVVAWTRGHDPLLAWARGLSRGGPSKQNWGSSFAVVSRPFSQTREARLTR